MDRGELKTLLQRVTWIFATFFAIGLVMSAIATKESSNVSDLIINIEPLPDGNALINKGDILLAIDRSFGYKLVTSPLAAVDVERLERVLEDESFILDADVFFDAKNKLKINVVQREPILRVISNSGADYYLDKEGVKMPPSQHFTTRVLVTTGNVPPHTPGFHEQKKHKLKGIFELVQAIRKDEFLNPLIEQIHINNNGGFVLIPKVGKHKILFGKTDNLNSKLKRLKAFYGDVLPYEGWNKHKTIDLRFKGHVYARKR